LLEKLDQVSMRSDGDGASRSGLFAQERARVEAQIADLDGIYDDVQARADIQRRRPPDCTCLGTGGVGRLVAVMSDGLVLFQDYCRCRDGQRAREAANWANETINEEEERDRQLLERRLKRAREQDILSRAGIDQRYAQCTFESYRKLLERRGLLTETVRKALDVMEHAYVETCDPLRGDYLHGPPGHGKTSLQIAMLRAWIEHGRSGIFMPCGDLLEQLKASFSRRDGSGDELLNRLRNTPFLILDDIAMAPMSAYERARLVNLIAARHAAGRRLLTGFTSQYSMRDVALRLTDDDGGNDYNRILRRLREMCDETHLVTGDLSMVERQHIK
jgi:DNA replication protein DnaC